MTSHYTTGMWRVNFGNGQVVSVPSKKAGVRLLAELSDCFAYLERYYPGYADDPGDWFRVRT